MRRMTVLITGATDGIGRELAQIYRRRGARLILVGRRANPALGPGSAVRYCRADLAQPYAAAIVAAFLRRQGIARLDLLIHCAGVGSYGPPAGQAPGQIDELLAVNLAAPLALTHALLPLLESAGGAVTFIGSVAAALPAPDYAVYAASKAGLEGLARSLRSELAGRVTVQLIHPGATRTAMHARVGAPLERIGWRRFPPPALVAARIAAAIDARKPRATIGAGNRLLRFAGRQLGGLADRLAARRLPAIPPAPQPAGEGPRHVVITGGADGIGRALAERYARAGCALTLVDIDAARAEALCAALRAAGARARAVIADLSRMDDVARALDALGALPPADLVIYSAGISAVGRFGRLGLAPQRAVLDVNLRAPLLLTAGMLGRGLVARGGALVFIASLSVFTGYPGAATYAASKDGLAAYARSLRAALVGSAIHVLTVYPGPTRTAHARRYSPDNRREGRRMPPERLAALIDAAVERRQPALVPGAANRLTATLGRVAPALAERLMRVAIFDRLP